MKSAARAGSKRKWTWPFEVPGSKRMYGKRRKGGCRCCSGPRRSVNRPRAAARAQAIRDAS